MWRSCDYVCDNFSMLMRTELAEGQSREDHTVFKYSVETQMDTTDTVHKHFQNL